MRRAALLLALLAALFLACLPLSFTQEPEGSPSPSPLAAPPDGGDDDEERGTLLTNDGVNQTDVVDRGDTPLLSESEPPPPPPKRKRKRKKKKKLARLAPPPPLEPEEEEDDDNDDVASGAADPDALPADQVGAYELVGVGYIVAVHLVAVPGTNKFFFMERPSGRHPDGKRSLAGYFDLDDRTFTNVDSSDSLFCAGHTILNDGNILVVGGHRAQNPWLDGMRSIRIFDRQALTLTTIAKMRTARWYPTATTLADGRVVIMGGTQKPGAGTANNPFYELWDPARPTAPTTSIDLDAEFVRVARDIYYPNNYLLPTGDLFVYCDRIGRVLRPASGDVIATIPSHTSIASAVRMQYPYTATSVMLPLLPEADYAVEVVFFGGQYSYGWVNSWAYGSSLRMGVSYAADGSAYNFSSWEREQMPVRRVMGDATLLPNGHVVVLNGAQQGVAGDSASGGAAKANEPAFYAALYNPYERKGRRYTQLARSPIARMYHSNAVLTIDGDVFVAGCDRCANFASSVAYNASRTGLAEYRVELFHPPYVYSAARPVITDAPPQLSYNEQYTVRYDPAKPADRAVLVTPGSNTHSTNNHQRVVGLRVLDNDAAAGTMVLEGPPHANIAMPGYYMLFLLRGDDYSKGAWVQLAPETRAARRRRKRLLKRLRKRATI